MALNTTFGATDSVVSKAPWVPDLGDGRYQNPVLYADYSDPDVIRVGEDYWMTASSFSHVPGLPVLHSKDLVNWTLVTHALSKLVPEDVFSVPQHGKGVWAPSLRYHDGKYWIFYPDPDFGIYVVTAKDPKGPWNPPVLVKGGKGLIDPSPLWDDDGSVYLVHGWARSRAGFANVLNLVRLSADGLRAEEDLGEIINGDKIPNYTTLEGPKFYKRGGWYYIFAPAGGVATGWQSVFRSKNIRGPYEDRIVLAQGKTQINGPHQGGLVDTPSGQEWFLHFQDKGTYGRIVHLQPVIWKEGWPVMGNDPDGDGTGEPVLVHAKPSAASKQIAVPATSDDFKGSKLGVQWQWQANPSAEWYALDPVKGMLRLKAQPAPNDNNFYHAPYLLMQKFPAPEFSATVRLEQVSNATAGLIVFGYDYAWIGQRGNQLVLVTVTGANEKSVVKETPLGARPAGALFLRVVVSDGGVCQFYFSDDNTTYTPAGEPFTASRSRWVGAKFGLFAQQNDSTDGYADFANFQVSEKD